MKERKLEYIDDCIDWLNTLKDILVKRKREINEGKEEIKGILNKVVSGGINQPMGHRFNKKQNEVDKIG